AAEHDRAGRVLVRPDLSLPNHPEVFVIGDAAGVQDQTGAMVPGVAPAAKQMGRYVGRVIAARVDETPSPPPFRYLSFGDLATIGRRAAVVNFGYLRLKGFVGWLFWSLVHIYFLIGVKHRFIVAFAWLWDYVTFHRGARLMTEVPPPGRGGALRWRSNPAEPAVSLILPVSAEIFVGDGHLHHVFRLLDAELRRHPHLHREAVLARQDLAIEFESHLGLRMQRGRHVDRGGIALGAAKPDIFRARIGADAPEELAERRAGPFTDRAPTFHADKAGDLGFLRQRVEFVEGPRFLVVDQAADFELVIVLVDFRRVLLRIIGVERKRAPDRAVGIGRRKLVRIEQPCLRPVVE